MCHVSHVTCHVSPFTCHLSPVTCHLSHVKKISFTFFFIKKKYIYIYILKNWWSWSVEGLLSTGPTPSSLITFIFIKMDSAQTNRPPRKSKFNDVHFCFGSKLSYCCQVAAQKIQTHCLDTHTYKLQYIYSTDQEAS